MIVVVLYGRTANAMTGFRYRSCGCKSLECDALKDRSDFDELAPDRASVYMRSPSQGMCRRIGLKFDRRMQGRFDGYQIWGRFGKINRSGRFTAIFDQRCERLEYISIDTATAVGKGDALSVVTLRWACPSSWSRH